MRSRFKIENPDEVLVTMTITMSAKEWCQLRDQMTDVKWPASRLSTAINNLLADVRKILWHEGKDGFSGAIVEKEDGVV